MVCSLRQTALFLHFDSPIIQGSGVQLSKDRYIPIDYWIEMSTHHEVANKSRVSIRRTNRGEEWFDFLLFHPGPKTFVLFKQFLRQGRTDQSIGRIWIELINQSVRLLIKQLKIVPKTRVQIIHRICVSHCDDRIQGSVFV